MQGIELDLLKAEVESGRSHGRVATWLSRGIKVEESQIWLARDLKRLGRRPTEFQQLALARRADRLGVEIATFLSEASVYLGNDSSERCDSDPSDFEDESGAEAWDEGLSGRPDQVNLPLPSYLGDGECRRLGVEGLGRQELQLRCGQANDSLHEIRLALANKAVLFRTEVRHASGHAKTTRAWSKVNALDAILGRHVAVYRRCRKAMINLGADDATLGRYQMLRDEDLKVSTMATEPNARGHRNESLAWFWTVDITGETETNDWMSECMCYYDASPPLTPTPLVYRVNWFRAKAKRDRWTEEEEFLRNEFEWTVNFFHSRAEVWGHHSVVSQNKGFRGPACYAARQRAIYCRLRDRCRGMWEGLQHI